MLAGVRAPSTLGSFLRAFTHGHALQLHAVHRRFLAALTAHTPLLSGAGEKAFIDVDSTHKRVYGRRKQGAEYGRFKGVRTLHPLLATICTPASRPVIATVRMRRGKAADSRGAPKLVSEALATAVEAGCTGLRILRADSQFYHSGVIAACRRTEAHFSVTTGMNPSIKRAILGIPGEAWQQITYPTAVPDPDTGELIADAEVAEIPAYTAFTGRQKSERVTARLIVRRVRDLAKPAVVGEQDELFPVWRYHPFFTDNPATTLQAEQEHRHHAVVEQVIADSKAGALAHLPSGDFHANAAWLTLWAMTYTLLRATGAPTSACHAKATTATLRAHNRNRTVGKLGRPAATTCPCPTANLKPARNRSEDHSLNHVGGSRLRGPVLPSGPRRLSLRGEGPWSVRAREPPSLRPWTGGVFPT
ncbi:IS1380 family transposase [Streptomyces platensis]|uniref:IS1380 family transposase n=1 Tax=Streptomyces platensis TaxID=58346 RepID=UPI003865143B|nr:IS1380 family transposase [Streptomyces platensis]